MKSILGFVFLSFGIPAWASCPDLSGPFLCNMESVGKISISQTEVDGIVTYVQESKNGIETFVADGQRRDIDYGHPLPSFAASRTVTCDDGILKWIDHADYLSGGAVVGQSYLEIEATREADGAIFFKGQMTYKFDGKKQINDHAYRCAKVSVH